MTAFAAAQGGIFDKNASDQEKLEKAQKADKLDLAGILNVLDGVVDTPGR